MPTFRPAVAFPGSKTFVMKISKIIAAVVFLHFVVFAWSCGKDDATDRGENCQKSGIVGKWVEDGGKVIEIKSNGEFWHDQVWAHIDWTTFETYDDTIPEKDGTWSLDGCDISIKLDSFSVTRKDEILFLEKDSMYLSSGSFYWGRKRIK